MKRRDTSGVRAQLSMLVIHVGYSVVLLELVSCQPDERLKCIPLMIESSIAASLASGTSCDHAAGACCAAVNSARTSSSLCGRHTHSRLVIDLSHTSIFCSLAASACCDAVNSVRASFLACARYPHGSVCR